MEDFLTRRGCHRICCFFTRTRVTVWEDSRIWVYQNKSFKMEGLENMGIFPVSLFWYRTKFGTKLKNPGYFGVFELKRLLLANNSTRIHISANEEGILPIKEFFDICRVITFFRSPMRVYCFSVSRQKTETTFQCFPESQFESKFKEVKFCRFPMEF